MKPKDFGDPLTFAEGQPAGYLSCFLFKNLNTDCSFAIKCGTDIHGPKRMNPNVFGDPLSPSVRFYSRKSKFVFKCTLNTSRFIKQVIK